MTKLSMVSVCMITYNHEAYIKQAFEGVMIQQTNFEIEFIIADDSSTDQTETVIRELINCYSDTVCIKYFRNYKNIGMMPNFIFALQQCTGKYIALCEGDDYWTDPLKLQKQVDFLEGNEGYALLFTNGNVIYTDKSKHTHPIYKIEKNPEGYYNSFEIPEKTTDIYNLAKGNYIHTPGVVFRNIFKAKTLPEYMSNVSIGDWPLYMYLATTGKIGFLNVNTFKYRVHQKGIYSKKTVLHKYQMTLGQFPGMLSFNGFNEKVLWEIKKYCTRSTKVYLNYCTKKEDLNFLNEFLKAVGKKDESYGNELINTLNNKTSKIKIKNGRLVFAKDWNLKKKLKSILKRIFR